jgi:hypothetical protein
MQIGFPLVVGCCIWRMHTASLHTDSDYMECLGWVRNFVRRFSSAISLPREMDKAVHYVFMGFCGLGVRWHGGQGVLLWRDDDSEVALL